MFLSRKRTAIAHAATVAVLGVSLLCGAVAYAQPTQSVHSGMAPQELAVYQPSAYKQRESHQAVIAHALGQGAERVYVFLPAQPQLSTERAVPIVFLQHGWQGMNPQNFGALIDHLARTGHVVIYPVYQESEKTSPQIVTAQAVQANKDALHYLAKQGLKPDLNRVLYVGFSMGAAISVNIAAAPDHLGLPAPKGLVLLAPGNAHHVAMGAQAASIISDPSKLPADLPVVVMTGAADTSIGVPTARQIAAQLCHIPADRRALLLLPSDTSDERSIKAGHGAPGAPDSRYNMPLSDQKFPRTIQGLDHFEASGSLNQLDFFGFWRAITSLNNSLTADRPVVLGAGTATEFTLGLWPNGVAFKPMQIEHPCGKTPVKALLGQ